MLQVVFCFSHPSNPYWLARRFMGVLPKHIFTWRSHVIPNECESLSRVYRGKSAEKTAAKPPTSSPKNAKCGKTLFGQHALYSAGS